MKYQKKRPGLLSALADQFSKSTLSVTAGNTLVAIATPTAFNDGFGERPSSAPVVQNVYKSPHMEKMEPNSAPAQRSTRSTSFDDRRTASSRDKWLATAIFFFRMTREISEASQLLGPLKAASGAAVLILQNIQASYDAQEAWTQLVNTIKSQQCGFDEQIARIPYVELDTESNSPITIPVAEYQQILCDILSEIFEEGNITEEEILANKASLKSIAKKIGRTNLDIKVINLFNARLQDADRTLMRSLTLYVATQMDEMKKKLDQIDGRLIPLSRRISVPSALDRAKLLKRRPPVVSDFIGREEVLVALHARHYVSRTEQLDSPTVSVICGMGGSGKTQVALKFAAEFEKRNTNIPVFFLDARTREILIDGLELIARFQTGDDDADSFQDALDWFAASDSWLVIMDNVDDPDFDVTEFIPRSHHGHLIITTRNSTLALLARDHTHYLGPLAADEAECLLLRIAGYPLTDDNRAASREIGAALENLPLAITHAGGYINVHRCLDTYSEMYRSNQAKLLAHKQAFLSNYSHSVATTIQLSLDRLPPQSLEFLRLLSFFQNTSIAYALFLQGAASQFRSREVGEIYNIQEIDAPNESAELLMKIVCPSGKWSEEIFNDTILSCIQHSLLRVSTDEGTRCYSMHPLVQAWLQSQLEDFHRLDAAFIRLIASCVTRKGRKTLAIENSLLPHIQCYMLRHTCAYRDLGDELAMATAAKDCGDHQLSLSIYQCSYEYCKETLGEDARLTLKIQGDVAIAHLHMGHFQPAVELHRDVIDRQLRTLGKDHEDTLWTMGNYSLCLQRLGMLKESLALKRLILASQERVLGPDHPHTLWMIGQVASTLSDLGQYEEALKLRQVVLDKRRRSLGAEHPDTLRAMGSLASCLRDLGQHQRALEIKETVLSLQKKVLGHEHPRTLWTMASLSSTLRKLGRFQEALEMNQLVLDIRARSLGPEHPYTLWTMGSLARSFADVGDYEQALVMLQNVVKLQKKVLRETHPETLQSMTSLAGLLLHLGRVNEALALSERALKLQRRLLGDDHHDTRQTMENLKACFESVGRLEEANELQERLLACDSLQK
ncbi:hypothetical protein FRC17_006871 [Serendipita sp. 399]|nr:hypothetical protein FRC17_006871 [Serendipita sp. 399]